MCTGPPSVHKDIFWKDVGLGGILHCIVLIYTKQALLNGIVKELGLRGFPVSGWWHSFHFFPPVPFLIVIIVFQKPFDLWSYFHRREYLQASDSYMSLKRAVCLWACPGDDLYVASGVCIWEGVYLSEWVGVTTVGRWVHRFLWRGMSGPSGKWWGLAGCLGGCSVEGDLCIGWVCLKLTMCHECVSRFVSLWNNLKLTLRGKKEIRSKTELKKMTLYWSNIC